jgi:hypothetical protein
MGASTRKGSRWDRQRQANVWLAHAIWSRVARSTQPSNAISKAETVGDSARGRWRSLSPPVAIYPRAPGDWDRQRWRFTRGCLAIAVATGGDSHEGVWRLLSPQVAIHTRVSGDWHRQSWRFTRGCLAIAVATGGDSGNGWWRSRSPGGSPGVATGIAKDADGLRHVERGHLQMRPVRIAIACRHRRRVEFPARLR